MLSAESAGQTWRPLPFNKPSLDRSTALGLLVADQRCEFGDLELGFNPPLGHDLHQAHGYLGRRSCALPLLSHHRADPTLWDRKATGSLEDEAAYVATESSCDGSEARAREAASAL
jgi:hypothetical protein